MGLAYKLVFFVAVGEASKNRSESSSYTKVPGEKAGFSSGRHFKRVVDAPGTGL
jgi:hypothetical protein